MYHFNQLYCTIIESTRRDFLKQVAGTVAAAAAPAAPAAPAVAAPTKFSLFAYDVGDAMNKLQLRGILATKSYPSNK
jgi:anaerobic selenocysteine-containing dehydrogenase